VTGSPPVLSVWKPIIWKPIIVTTQPAIATEVTVKPQQTVAVAVIVVVVVVVVIMLVLMKMGSSANVARQLFLCR